MRSHVNGMLAMSTNIIVYMRSGIQTGLAPFCGSSRRASRSLPRPAGLPYTRGVHDETEIREAQQRVLAQLAAAFAKQNEARDALRMAIDIHEFASANQLFMDSLDVVTGALTEILPLARIGADASRLCFREAIERVRKANAPKLAH